MFKIAGSVILFCVAMAYMAWAGSYVNERQNAFDRDYSGPFERSIRAAEPSAAAEQLDVVLHNLEKSGTLKDPTIADWYASLRGWDAKFRALAPDASAQDREALMGAYYRANMTAPYKWQTSWGSTQGSSGDIIVPPLLEYYPHNRDFGNMLLLSIAAVFILMIATIVMVMDSK